MKRGKAGAVAITALLLLQALLLSGCWNNRDLTRINIVSALGIDRTDDGRVLLTVQVVEPAAIQSTSSGKGKGGGAQPKPVFIESYEGDTVFGALRGMLSVVDQKLFLNTCQILILGERLSESNIADVLDFFQRDHEIEFRMDVLVADGATPEEILRIETDMDSIPAVYIKGTVENAVSRGTAKRAMLIDLIKDISGGRQIALGRITKWGENGVRTEGAAVFRDGRLAGWLDAYETRGYLFAAGGVKGGIVNVPADTGKIAMEIIRSNGRVGVKFENGEPALLTVRVELEANVGEYDASGDLDSPESLCELEKGLEEEVKKEIEAALDRTQKDFTSDIFGFGTQLHKYRPQYWKGAKDGWNEVFAKLPADISVDAKIERTGVARGPLRKEG